MLSSNFSYGYKCFTELKDTPVCICPQGFYDYQCASATINQCFMLVTNPPFYQRCSKEDTAEYMYSIPGFDPCYPIDFSKPFELKYKIQCQPPIPALATIGFPYRDVVTPPTYTPFEYIAVNPESKFAVIQDTIIQVQVAL